jgi:hypothetical protein
MSVSMQKKENEPKEPGSYQLGNMIVEVVWSSAGNLCYRVPGNSALFDISYVHPGLEWGKRVR